MRVVESHVNTTPFEPERENAEALEIFSAPPLSDKVYANEGLCQKMFFRSDAHREIHSAGCRATVSNGRSPRFR
jgi:dCTP deaminase